MTNLSQNSIRLSTVLLLIFSLAIILNIGMTSSDYFLLSFFILLAFVINIILDIRRSLYPERSNYYHYLKLITIICLFVVLVGSITIGWIGSSANQTDKVDSAVQIEESIKMLLHGKNFYTESFLHTRLDNYAGFGTGKYNPAIDHFVYLPFITIFSVPFYVFFQGIFHWYNQQIVFIPLFILTLLILYKVAQDKEKKLLSVVLLGFNPLLVPLLIKGYNDFFVLFWIVLSVYLLVKNKFIWSAIALAPAIVSKQLSWLILPFYFLYLGLYFKQQFPKQKVINIVKLVLKKTYPLFIICALVLIPFLIWDWHAMYEDTILYNTGKLATSYPMVGDNISFLVLKLGWAHSPSDYFPFWILQLIFCLPILYLLIRWQIKNNTINQMLVSHGLLLIIFIYFARFMQMQYVLYVGMILLVAYFFGKADMRQKA